MVKTVLVSLFQRDYVITVRNFQIRSFVSVFTGFYSCFFNQKSINNSSIACVLPIAYI